MCHFITAALPAEADLKELRGVAERFGWRLEPLENAVVQRQLPSGAQYLLTTSGHCDCGTVLGAADRSHHTEAKQTRELKRLRRKHPQWSGARLRQRLGEQECAAAESELEEAGSWVDLLRALLTQPDVRWVGLLLHWYGGDLRHEAVVFLREETLLADDLQPEFLLSLKEDVLYRVQR